MKSGDVLAHYEVGEKIGAGGMGEVYRATDTKLGRDVALKVLPAGFADHPDRLARFRNEARTLASIQHPNVASIYGLEEIGDDIFLVMELVEGDDLSQRLARGPLPTERVLEIAGQIAAGLEDAHDKGIVHRDLKPANVKLGEDGKVKILDFGLARAYEGDTIESDPSTSPTMTAAMTQAGVILGTAAYMSPEQARGKKVDQRADLWALGVIIFEMLTGQQLFGGETVSDTLAGVLRKEVPWDDLPDELPPSLRRVLRRCLERDYRKRQQSAGDLRLELSHATGETPVPADTTMIDGRRGVPRRLLAVLIVAVAVLAALAGRMSAPRNDGEAVVEQLDIDLTSEGRVFDDLGPGALLTPDGRSIVFIEEVAALRRLMVRNLGDDRARPLAGTEGAVSPFLSPDGEWVGFFAAGRMQKVWLRGGTPLEICRAEGMNCRGADWGPDDRIVFASTTNSGISVVDAGGGEPVVLTTLDPEASERSHRWPAWTHDGTYVLFNTQHHTRDYHDGNIEVVEVGTGVRRVLHRGGAFPRPVDDRHVTFVRENTVFLLEVDGNLDAAGEPRPVLSELLGSTGDETAGDGSAVFHYSRSGDILFRRGQDLTPDGYLGLVDFDGRITPLDAPRAPYFYPRVSPDGVNLAVTAVRNGRNEVWLYDLTDGSSSRLVSSDDISRWGLWSGDGEFFYFSQGGGASRAMYRIFVPGGGQPEVVMRDTTTFNPHELSQDDRWLLIARLNEETSWDILRIDLGAHPQIPVDPVNFEPVVATQAQDGEPRLSFDGRWLAYDSYDSGILEVYLCDFTNPGRRWMISDGGGQSPRWSDDGKRIYYLRGETVMAVDIQPGQGGVRPSNPVEVFSAPINLLGDISTYDKIPGRDAFVMVLKPDEDDDSWPGDVVLMRNWRATWDDVRGN